MHDEISPHQDSALKVEEVKESVSEYKMETFDSPDRMDKSSAKKMLDPEDL